MPITTNSIPVTAYAVDSRAVAFVNDPAPVGHAGGVRYRGEHILYPLAVCRFNRVVNPATVHDAREHLVFNANAAGDTIYLHYENDHISSVRLPSPAPAGVDLFVTDNMSGCKFFVDTIGGSNDLMVYHANTHLHGSGALADCDAQTGNADTFLNNMRLNAAGEYAPVVLANVASCAKPRYCRNAATNERQLTRLGYRSTNPITPRQDASFIGGTTIFGFPAGGTWQFWFQTWGDFDRQKPGVLEVRRFRSNIQHAATEVHAATNTDMNVIEYGQFH